MSQGKRTTMQPTFDERMAAELDPQRQLCPLCGRDLVIPTTKGGRDYGVCTTCYMRAKNSALRHYAHDIQQATEYDAARQLKHKAEVRADRLGTDYEKIPCNRLPLDFGAVS